MQLEIYKKDFSKNCFLLIDDIDFFFCIFGSTYFYTSDGNINRYSRNVVEVMELTRPFGKNDIIEVKIIDSNKKIGFYKNKQVVQP